MFQIGNMPTAGSVVIVVIGALFVLSLILLFAVYIRYKSLASGVKNWNSNRNNRFLDAAVNEYAAPVISCHHRCQMAFWKRHHAAASKKCYV